LATDARRAGLTLAPEAARVFKYRGALYAGIHAEDDRETAR